MNYDSDDENLIPPPISAYTDRLIPEYSLIPDQDDLQKVIQESIELFESNQYNSIDNDYKKALDASLESLREDENIDEIEKAIQESLKSLNADENIEEIEKAIQESLKTNEDYEIIANEQNIKNQNINIINSFFVNLKRINGLQKNSTIQTLINIIDEYINTEIYNVSIDKEKYNNIFNEIRNIRCNPEIFNVLKSIINTNVIV